MTADNLTGTVQTDNTAVPVPANKARANPVLPKHSPLGKLVESVKKVLDQTSGFDLKDVDADKIVKLMEGYESNEEEWGRYAISDPSRAYTRNLVSELNDKGSLVGCNAAGDMNACLTDHVADVMKDDSCLECWQTEPDPQPWKRALRDEDLEGDPDRMPL